MYTLRKHFNTEKNRSNPNIDDFKSVLVKLREESSVVQKPLASPMFATFNLGKHISRVYAYGAIGFAALILMVISNTGNTNAPVISNLAMNTQTSQQIKTSKVNDAINLVDSVDSFGDVAK